MSPPLVTVTTSCFNHEKYLDEYFAGLLGQTYTNVELFIYDDGSADRSWEIIQSYETRLREKFPIVHLERHENMGAWRERLIALGKATGEYFCWLDSDDYYFPTKIEENVKYLEAHPEAGVVHSDLDILYSDRLVRSHWKTAGKDIPTGHVLHDLLLGKFYITPVVACFRMHLYRKHVKTRDYFAKGYRMGDVPALLDLAAHTQFGYIDKPLAVYRHLRGSMAHPGTADQLMKFRKSMCRVGMDYAEKYSVPEEIREAVEKSYYRELYNSGYDCFIKSECLGGYRWLMHRYPAEYGTFYHRMRAWGVRVRPLWNVLRYAEEKQLVYRFRGFVKGLPFKVLNPAGTEG